MDTRFEGSASWAASTLTSDIDSTIAFIEAHEDDDPDSLILRASRYPDINIPFAAEQIAARRRIRDKLPSWYANRRLIYPSKLSAEQCSSEWTATYKQQLISEKERVCDLTGGLGIDAFYLSRKASQLTYIECIDTYCQVARHNFACLNATNITVLEGEAESLLSTLPPVDVFYIDPARRSDCNKRLYALSDCSPDLSRLLPVLMKYAPKVIAKLSPMADISRTLELLPATTAIHVLSVRNDCKELLYIIERDVPVTTPAIHCVNRTVDTVECFSFTPDEERDTCPHHVATPLSYLYEPNASIMKAGAFRSITRLGVGKLHPNTHIYTSEKLLSNFPGRIFRICKVIPFRASSIKTLRKEIPHACITVRNFPLSADELRRRTSIADSNSNYLFGVTLADDSRVLILCQKDI